MTAVGAVLMACSLGGLGKGEEGQPEPAALRDPQWSVRLSGVADPVVAQVAGDAVVVVADEKVTVLDRRNGRHRWSRPTGSPSYRARQQVAVAGDSVVVTGSDATVVYDLTNGDERFQWSHNHAYVNNATATESGLLVQSCDDAGKCTVSLLDLRTGKPLWQRAFTRIQALLPPTPPDSTPGPGGVSATDLVDALAPASGKEAIMVTRGQYGDSGRAPDRATRLDVKTGAVLGTFAIPPGADGTNEWRSAWLVDDLVIQAEEPCGPYRVYDAHTGALRWNRVVNQRQLDLSASGVTVGEATVGCKEWPSVVDGGLLVSTPQDQPQIVDPKTGEPQWTAASRGIWLGYHDGLAMMWTDPDGPYLAADTATNKQLWTHRPPWLQKRDPAEAKMALVAYAVAGGQFFYSGKEDNGSYDYRSVVRVLDLRTGRPVWAAKGENRLIGVGGDWVVTTSVPGYGKPTDIRLFKR